MTILAITAVLVLLAGAMIGFYNSLALAKNRVKNRWDLPPLGHLTLTLRFLRSFKILI